MCLLLSSPPCEIALGPYQQKGNNHSPVTKISEFLFWSLGNVIFKLCLKILGQIRVIKKLHISVQRNSWNSNISAVLRSGRFGPHSEWKSLEDKCK